MKKKLILFLLIMTTSCGNNSNTIEKISKEGTLKEKTENNEKIILALGDSLTAGYNLDIKDSFPSQLEDLLRVNQYHYKVKNGGVSGDTSKNLLDRIELYDDIDVDIYLLGIGSNDGLRLQNIEIMKSNINQIISHIKEVNPDGIIILEGMQMPLNVGVKYAGDFKKAFTDIYKDRKIYLYEFLLKGVATKKELNLNDGIHPNKKGYKIIAENLYHLLKENKLIIKHNF